MNRRHFITGMAGILLAGQSPWVWTSGVMRPEQRIVTFTLDTALGGDTSYEFLTPEGYGPWTPAVADELAKFAERYIRNDSWIPTMLMEGRSNEPQF
jgi:hypothetical protein